MNPIKNKKDLEATIDELRKYSYSYLEKYNPSKQQLKIYLFKKFLKKREKIYNKRELFDLIDEVILNIETESTIKTVKQKVYKLMQNYPIFAY